MDTNLSEKPVETTEQPTTEFKSVSVDTKPSKEKKSCIMKMVERNKKKGLGTTVLDY